MGSSWESMVVAFGVIFLFYFGKRYANKFKKPQNSKKGSVPKTETKQLEMILTKKDNKRSRTKENHSENTAANLVLHPHSFQRAKREYMEFARRFTGSYEALYLAASGKAGIGREQLLKNWEEGVLATEAPNLTLAWNTVVQKHSGRNLYFKGISKGKSGPQELDGILKDWLKLLFKWGLQRHPGNLLHSDPNGGDIVAGQDPNYYWLLNGEVLEEGQVKVQSLGQ